MRTQVRLRHRPTMGRRYQTRLETKTRLRLQIRLLQRRPRLGGLEARMDEDGAGSGLRERIVIPRRLPPPTATTTRLFAVISVNSKELDRQLCLRHLVDLMFDLCSTRLNGAPGQRLNAGERCFVEQRKSLQTGNDMAQRRNFAMVPRTLISRTGTMRTRKVCVCEHAKSATATRNGKRFELGIMPLRKLLL